MHTIGFMTGVTSRCAESDKWKHRVELYDIAISIFKYCILILNLIVRYCYCCRCCRGAGGGYK